jgi:hypothetical protein
LKVRWDLVLGIWDFPHGGLGYNRRRVSKEASMIITRRAAVWAVLGLAACAFSGGAGGCRGRAPGVPEGAKFVKATKRRNTYAAPHDGTVYVVDDWYNRLVYSGPVKQGEEVVVDPGASMITVGGKDVAGGRKLSDVDHSVYMGPGNAEAR